MNCDLLEVNLKVFVCQDQFRMKSHNFKLESNLSVLLIFKISVCVVHLFQAVLLQKALDNLSPNGLNCNVSVSENVSTVKEALHAALAAHALSSSSSALHGSAGQAARNTNTAIHRVKKVRLLSGVLASLFCSHHTLLF